MWPLSYISIAGNDKLTAHYSETHRNVRKTDQNIWSDCLHGTYVVAVLPSKPLATPFIYNRSGSFVRLIMSHEQEKLSTLVCWPQRLFFSLFVCLFFSRLAFWCIVHKFQSDVDSEYIIRTYHDWPSQMHENWLISRVKTRAKYRKTYFNRPNFPFPSLSSNTLAEWDRTIWSCLVWLLL